MATTIDYRFVVKRDTAANFIAANTLLLQGEFALETDTNMLKMGDGSTPWNSLAYWLPGQLSKALDTAFSSTQGALLYRDASAWKALAPGSAGQVLQTNGAAANPSWVTPSGSGGGGSSPYTPPLLANFTVANQPAGSTFADTSTGLQIVAATNALRLTALKDSTAVGGTATVACGMAPFTFGGSTFCGIWFADSSGKVCCFGGNPAGNFGGLMTYWTAFGGTATTPVNNSGIVYPKYLRVVYNGSTFVCYGGADLNGMEQLFSVAASTYLSTPNACGLFACPNGAGIVTVFNDYTHTP